MNYKISGFADEISMDLSEQVRHITGLGMKYIEMRGVDGDNLIYHTDEKVREIKRVLDGSGISLSALGSPLGKIDITDDFDKHFEEYKRAVEIAHMMDCRNIRMFSYYIPQDEAPAVYETAVFERTGRFVDYARVNDVVLLHENEKGIYGAKAPECRKLMDTFFGDHFKAVFDFANFVQCRQDTLEAYEMLKSYIVYIHVKDALWSDGSVVPSGCGDGHVADILQQLFSDGFDGFLSIEPHLSEFTGFAGLEKNDKISLGSRFKFADGSPLSGPDAFTLAHSALTDILEGI